MGFFSKLIKKILPLRDAISIFITGLRIAWFISMFVFAGYSFSTFLTIYNYLHDIMDNLSGNTQLAGSDSLNNYSDIAWSLLNSLGIVDVFNTFLPLILSNLSAYLLYAALRFSLSLKDKIINELRRMANLGLGSS